MGIWCPQEKKRGALGEGGVLGPGETYGVVWVRVKKVLREGVVYASFGRP